MLDVTLQFVRLQRISIWGVTPSYPARRSCKVPMSAAVLAARVGISARGRGRGWMWAIHHGENSLHPFPKLTGRRRAVFPVRSAHDSGMRGVPGWADLQSPVAAVRGEPGWDFMNFERICSSSSCRQPHRGRQQDASGCPGCWLCRAVRG